jgi:aryl-alcohol dehydrogenase-like predicted oxidoreductase
VQQFECSIFAHDVEPLLAVLEELGISLVAYSPLARCFLSVGESRSAEPALCDRSHTRFDLSPACHLS